MTPRWSSFIVPIANCGGGVSEVKEEREGGMVYATAVDVKRGEEGWSRGGGRKAKGGRWKSRRERKTEGTYDFRRVHTGADDL